jgi:hypothetical protein
MKSCGERDVAVESPSLDVNRRILLAVAVATTLCSCASPASVRWLPGDIVVDVPPNGFRSADVMALRSPHAAEVSLHLSPSIRLYLRVTPEALPASEGSASRIRLDVSLPDVLRPHVSLTGVVDARAGRRIVGRLTVTIQTTPSTPEGTLRSVRAAIDARDPAGYAKQFVPERRQRQRDVFGTLADRALDTLSDGVRTAELESMSDDGTSARYRIVVRLGPDRTETLLTLRRGSDGIWRLLGF